MSNMSRTLLILLIAFVAYASAFQAPLQRSRLATTAVNAIVDDGDFPPEEDNSDYSGNVDWDAEWKKVVASEGKLDGGAERPGKEFYKSEAEVAAIKATNKAAANVAKAGAGVADAMPDIRSMSGDWKVCATPYRMQRLKRIAIYHVTVLMFFLPQFWIAILAIISVGISLLTAPPADMAPPNDGSYYI